MLRIRTLLNTRSRYIGAFLVLALFLALVFIIVVYGPRVTGLSSRLAALDDAQRAWLEQKDTLRIGGRWEEPPFAFFDEAGTYKGYEVDLARSLGPILGIAIEVVPMPHEEALIAMANGEIDAVMGMVQDPKASDKYGFTEPYVSSSVSIFVRSERFDVTSLSGLQDRTVAVQADTAAEGVLGEQTGILPIGVQSAEEGLELVADEQVTALVADEIVGLRAVQRMGLHDEIKVVGVPTAGVSYSFAVPKADDAALGVLNHALASIEAVGLRQQVDRAWFGTPVARTEVAATNPLVTIALGIVVGGLVVGNAIYLVRKLRRRSEEYTVAIEESQTKYRKLVEGTDEAVFSISRDGSLLEINSRMESLTGFGKDELLRMSLDDLVVPSQRQSMKKCVERASQQGLGTLDDVSLLNRHRDEVPVQLSAHVVSQADRRIIQCIARDVRERKRMRHQVLRRSEDLSSINAIANMVSHVLDLEEVLEKVLAKVLELTQTEGGVVYLIGSRDEEMVPVVRQGLTEELKVAMEWPQGPQKLADEVVESEKVLISAGFAQSSGSSRPRAVGGLGTRAGIPLTSKDRVHGVMAIYGREPRRFTDEDVELLTAIGNQIGVAIENAQLIHQLQRTVSEVGAMKRFNDGILRNMTNGLVVVDKKGKIRLVNRAGERMLGCEEDEVLGSSVEEVLGSGAEIVRDSLERTLVYSGREVAVRRDGGGSIPLGMSVSPLRDDAGKLNGVVVMLSDLREAKALEEERRRLDRLALLGEMSAVMAHEIRNPLAGMVAGIQHMLTKFEERDDRREAMERILRESERVNRIIEDILLISRPPHLNLVPCDLSEVVEGVISSWEEKAGGQGVQVSKYYASELPLVRGDRMRLHQALSNLVLNGIEAMPDGGELNVAVTGPAQAGPGLRGEEGYVEIEIRDSGVGIKEEEIEKIFEPFYTTKARGTGLGLPITRRIITEHGGEVEVESEEGEGTRFVVRLPLAGRGGS